MVEVFDRDYALDLIGGDEDLLREILGLFLEEVPRLLSEMTRSFECADGPALKRQAHTLAGVAGNFGLPKVVEAARTIESETSDGPSSSAFEAFGTLRALLESVMPTLMVAFRANP
jgi:HPt (histidine-containing phosphotransfer) domain-containing protein